MMSFKTLHLPLITKPHPSKTSHLVIDDIENLLHWLYEPYGLRFLIFFRSLCHPFQPYGHCWCFLNEPHSSPSQRLCTDPPKCSLLDPHIISSCLSSESLLKCHLFRKYNFWLLYFKCLLHPQQGAVLWLSALLPILFDSIRLCTHTPHSQRRYLLIDFS